MLPCRPGPSRPLERLPSPAFGTHITEHVIQPASSLLPGGSVYPTSSRGRPTRPATDLIARPGGVPAGRAVGRRPHGFTGRVAFSGPAGTARSPSSPPARPRTPTRRWCSTCSRAGDEGRHRAARPFVGLALSAGHQAILAAPRRGRSRSCMTMSSTSAWARPARRSNSRPSDPRRGDRLWLGIRRLAVHHRAGRRPGDAPAGTLLIMMTGALAPWTGWTRPSPTRWWAPCGRTTSIGSGAFTTACPGGPGQVRGRPPVEQCLIASGGDVAAAVTRHFSDPVPR